MAKFLMWGKYSPQGIKGINSERTKKAVRIIGQSGGKINSMYALLGEHDLLFVVDFPGVPQVFKASTSLTKLTGIAFTSSPAIDVKDFDRIRT
ncbi:MAG: GYD domain-containing protein [Planctomycetota bacterium]